MVNQKPASSDVLVPAALLSAFEQPVFSRDISRIPQVTAVEGDRFKIGAAQLQGVAYSESEFVVLRGTEPRRRARMIVLEPVVHRADAAPQALGKASAALSVSVIIV